MRTFISVNIPKEVQKEIEKIQNKLPEFYGKKTELGNLHLTLKFLGEIDKEKVDEVKEKLREIEFSEFETKIDSIGIFSEKFIKIIWLHLDNYEQLQKIIDEKLSGLFEPEKRFMGHLTIARVKNIGDKKKFLGEVKKIKIPEMGFKVKRFCLMKSWLKEQGPEYEVLEKYELKEKI